MSREALIQSQAAADPAFAPGPPPCCLIATSQITTGWPSARVLIATAHTDEDLRAARVAMFRDGARVYYSLI
ncbi:MAG TPA: hypothetical protein VH351_00960 [Bryobacteraceae bacterium]|jgi:hypothetical protein|nr:hypothetical protein [Bryobacteraceae bacterium]